MKNPLDGDYKFNHCIYRAENEGVFEVHDCGSCTGKSSFVKGYKCKQFSYIIEDHNRSELCGNCFGGKYKDENGEIKDFPKPWESA